MEGSSTFVTSNEYLLTFDEGQTSVYAKTGGKLNCRVMYLAYSGVPRLETCLVRAILLCQIAVETKISQFSVRHRATEEN